MRKNSNDRFFVLLLVGLWLLLYFPNHWGRDFSGTDEPKYAQVAREALLEGHWFALHFNGLPYHGEPPLYFWLEALFSLPRGDVTEFTAILPSSLSALGTILVVYFLGKRLFSMRAGLLGAMVLASLPQFHKFGCITRLDVPFAFFITSSLAAFYFGYTDPARRRKYFLMTWLLMGLAAITKKGPLAFLLVGAVIFIFLWRRKELALLRETQPLLGGLIATATILVWLLPAYWIEGRGYIEGLFGQFESHIKTPLGAGKFLFYFTEVLAGTLPWSLFLPSIFYKAVKGGMSMRENKGLEFPCLWFFIILLTFCIALQKFSRYILPLYPAVALLVGNLWDGYMEKRPLNDWSGRKKAIVAALGIPLGAVVAWTFFKSHIHEPIFSPTGIAIMSLGLITLLWALRVSYQSGQSAVLFAFIFLATCTFEMTYDRLLFPWQNENRSEKPLCLRIANLIEPGTPWAIYKTFRPAHVFYTKSHPRNIGSENDLIPFLSSRERVYCLILEEDYQGLNSRSGIDLFVVEKLKGPHRRTANLLLISNKPPRP
ncbi:MAG TPA: ArnT family glycosyltransferase [Candidatus Hypogeohydataceae bacterium YC38]|nr:glycosyltransferase family 39 protein [Candidatus Brocadiales bacterium]